MQGCEVDHMALIEFKEKHGVVGTLVIGVANLGGVLPVCDPVCTGIAAIVDHITEGA